MKKHLKFDIAIKLMIGKIPVQRKDPFYLIHAIQIIRNEKAEILSFYNLLDNNDKLLFKSDLAKINNAINNYKPNFV